MAETSILIDQTADGRTKIETRLEDETVWLTIDQMAELFQKSRSTINEHILQIFEERELDSQSSMRKIGNSDFSTKPTHYYNLDVRRNRHNRNKAYGQAKQDHSGSKQRHSHCSYSRNGLHFSNGNGKEGEARAADTIKNWIRTRYTLEYLGVWEQMNNPDFKVVEFDHFKSQAGLPSFVLRTHSYL